jgi:hypothetical protein
MMEEANWLQTMEGDLDSNVLDWLHRRFDATRRLPLSVSLAFGARIRTRRSSTSSRPKSRLLLGGWTTDGSGTGSTSSLFPFFNHDQRWARMFTSIVRGGTPR